MLRNVGKFAGAYSIITDRVVLNQDTSVSRHDYKEIDYEFFKKHYWDFGSEDKPETSDPNS